jgi:hypothetical protein
MVTTIAVGLASSLAGCAVGPDYRKPSLTPAPLHSSAALRLCRTTAPAPGLAQRWLGIDDPELTRIAQRALHRILDLAAAMARVEQAQAAVREAGAQLLPAADLTAQAASGKDQVTTDEHLVDLVEHLPVVLTALAGVLAFIPLTASVFWGPMAVTLIGGTIGSTVLTLLFLPALYAIWFRMRATEGKIPLAQAQPAT